MRFVLVAFLSLMSAIAQGKSWRIEGVAVSDEVAARLKQQFNEIQTAAELEELIALVSRFITADSIEAVDQGGQWVIRVRSVNVIRDVRVDVPLSALRVQIETLTREFIDDADTPFVRSKMTSAVKQLLMDKGFVTASITVTDSIDERGIYLDMHIETGPICQISEVKPSFVLPQGVSVELPQPPVCGSDEIAQTVAALEERLQEAGFRQSKFNKPQLRFSDDGRSAELLLSGSVGKKIEYRVNRGSEIIGLDGIFESEDLSRVDQRFISPDSMKSEIERSYQAKGYADASVTGPVVEDVSPQHSIYTFTVRMGTRYRLSFVEFVGNESFTDGELIDAMGIGGGLSGDAKYNLEMLRQGLDAVRAKYQDAGFWDARLREPRINMDRESGQVQVQVLVDEGVRRLFGDLKISGASAFNEETIRALLKIGKDGPLDRGELLEFERRLRSKYISLGFLYADLQVNLEQRLIDGVSMVDVVVEIIEGKRVKVGIINVSGLVRTADRVVRRELTFSTGDWYSADQIDISRRALIGLGLFRTVQIQPIDRRGVDTKKSDVIDLEVAVRESNPGTISFGPGWSIFRGQRFNSEASYNNIGGVGRQVFVRARVSEEANQQAISSRSLLGRAMSIGYKEPWLLDLPIDGSISAGTKAEASGNFWNIARSGEVALSHRFHVPMLAGSEITSFYGRKDSEIVAEPGNAEIETLGSQVRIGHVGIRYKLDLRDNLSWPTSGTVFRTETSWARYNLGGDLNYFFWEVENNYFIKIIPNVVVAIGGNLSAYEDVSIKDNPDANVVPLTERLSLAGTTIVRGYQEDSLGPIQKYGPNSKGVVPPDALAKGSHLSLFHFEIRHLWKADTLAGSVFADSGTVFFTPEEQEYLSSGENELADNIPYEFSELPLNSQYLWSRHYTSHGFSVNYLTPIGSVNVAYGIPWKRCPGTKSQCTERRGRNTGYWWADGQLHINVGATF